MNPSLKLHGALPLILVGALSVTAPALAGDVHTTHLVKVATGDSEIIEADVSELGLGESKSFVTESGRTVDMLRVPEGIELYLDGELIETGDLSAIPGDRLALHEEIVTVDCDEEASGECDALVDIVSDLEAAGDMNVIIARHQVEEICDQDGECDVQVWVDQDSDVTIDVDADVLHEADREFIIIRKEIHADSE